MSKWNERGDFYSKRGQLVYFASFLVFFHALAFADVTFSNSAFSLTIADDGKVSSVVRSSDQTELITSGASGEGWHINKPESDVLHNLTMTDLGNGRLQFSSATNPELMVIVKVSEESRYIKFALESVSNTGQPGVLDEGDGLYSEWAPYSVGFQLLSSITGGNVHFFALDYMS